MNNIISFFGASTTQQKSGYAIYLIGKLGEGTTTFIHGYGGDHIDSAGICFIDEVFKK